MIFRESVDQYALLWKKTRETLMWDCPFVLPYWLQTILRYQVQDGEAQIFTAVEDHQVIGIVPMVLNNGSARFLGPHHLCDYQDIVAAPGKATEVMRALAGQLRALGIQNLELRTLRPDAQARTAIDVMASQHELILTAHADEHTFETGLPAVWDDYLIRLSAKQRHEVRRKLRRLQTHGPYVYRVQRGDGRLEEDTEIFFKLFRSNREEKARFMGSAMEAYFKGLIQVLAEHDLLRLCFLEVKDEPAAAVFCFDYQGVRYLYNSGYDSRFDDLSVGILSKVFSIQGGIECGCRTYDFLKGDEVYKGRIGGRQTALYRYSIELLTGNA